MPYGVGGAAAEGIQSGFEMGRSLIQDAERKRQFDAEIEIRRANEERLAKQENDRYGRMQDAAQMAAVQSRLDALEKLANSIIEHGHQPPPQIMQERAQLSVQLEDMQRSVAATGRLAPTGAGVAATAPRPNVASAQPPAAPAAPLPDLSQSAPAAPSGMAGSPQAQPTPAPGGVGTSPGAAPQGLGPQPGPVGAGVDGLAPPGALPASAVAPPAPAVPGGAPQAAAAASPTTSAVTPNQSLVTGEDQKAQDLASRLNTGQMSLNQVAPGDFAMMMTSALKRAPTADAMGEVRQGLADFHAGMQTGNNGLTIQGLNGVYGPQVNQGVGQPSDFGGNVVSKKVVGLDPAMSADGTVHPDRVMPRLQVTTDALGPDGAPLTYHAPMLGADGKVAAIPMADAMNHLGATGALLEAAAHPDAQALLAKGAADPRVAAYLQALQQQAEPVSKAQIVENNIQAYMARNHVDRATATQAFIDASDLPYHPLKGTALQDIAAAQQLMALDPSLSLTDALGRVAAATHGITKYSPFAVPGAAGGGAGGAAQSEALSPGGLKVATELASKGLPLPGGYSKAGISRGNAILNAMAEQEDGGAGSGGAVAGITGGKADATSLTFQQKRVDAIESGMRKIQKDISIVTDTISKGNADLQPWLNKPLNALRTATGDPSLAAYALAVHQVATEYERQITGGQLSVAQLHVGAQEQADKVLNGSMTVAQVNAVLPIMLREIENGRQAANDQLAEIKGRLRNKPAGVQSAAAPAPDAASPSPAAPTKKLVYDPATGTIH